MTFNQINVLYIVTFMNTNIHEVKRLSQRLKLHLSFQEFLLQDRENIFKDIRRKICLDDFEILNHFQFIRDNKKS